ncbi:hypothetical protein TWF281_005372 [Arthrobotrys megalospora]
MVDVLKIWRILSLLCLALLTLQTSETLAQKELPKVGTNKQIFWTCSIILRKKYRKEDVDAPQGPNINLRNLRADLRKIVLAPKAYNIYDIGSEELGETWAIHVELYWARDDVKELFREIRRRFDPIIKANRCSPERFHAVGTDPQLSESPESSKHNSPETKSDPDGDTEMQDVGSGSEHGLRRRFGDLYRTARPRRTFAKKLLDYRAITDNSPSVIAIPGASYELIRIANPPEVE